jgi:8-oxo-dGDP phosphatase
VSDASGQDDTVADDGVVDDGASDRGASDGDALDGEASDGEASDGEAADGEAADGGSPAWFATQGSRTVYDGRVRVRVDAVRTPDGRDVEREIVEARDAVAVVAVDTRDRVLLLRQYRQVVGGYVLEIPAGVLDVDGEDPAAAARRELAEEVQHDVAELEHLVTYLSSGGWTTERVHVYLGRGCTPGQLPTGFALQAEEADMEIVALSLADAVTAAREGAIVDAKSLVGLLLAGSVLGVA